MNRLKMMFAEFIVDRAVKAFNKAYVRVNKAQDMIAKSIEGDVDKELKLRESIHDIEDKIHAVEQEKADKSDKMQKNAYLMRNLELFMQEDEQ